MKKNFERFETIFGDLENHIKIFQQKNNSVNTV